MKESGIDWIGQIPEEWEVIKFKYLGDVKQGLTYSPSDIVDNDEGILVLRSGNIQNGVLDFTNNVYVKTKVAESIVLRKNDILITARNGSSALIGKNAIIDTDIKATFGAFMMVFRTNKSLIAKFAFYLMNISFNFYRTFFTTSTVNQLTAAIFNGIEVSLPSISEQQKIADFLDKKTTQLDKVKSLLEEQIQKLKDYRASLIYETVTKGLDKTVPMKDSGIDWIGQVPEGWGVSRLKYLANKIGSGKTPLGGSEIFEETGILFIRSQNIYNGLILLEDKATYINRNIHQQMIGTCVKKNDILLNITGASIGRVAKYDLDIEANVNQHVCIIRSNRYVLPDYLMYFIMSEFGQFMIKTHQISGNREGLSFENIGNFKIIAPGLDYQYEISQYLNKKMLTINQMIKTKEQQIANINKQRQTLIYDYVTGKKRV